MRFKLLGILPEYINKSWHGSQAPAPIVMKDKIRLWFSARDQDGYSQATFYDLSLDDPVNGMIQQNYRVQIPLGQPGEVDEHGVMISQALPYRLLYTGWNKTGRGDVRYRTACMSMGINKVKTVLMDRSCAAPCGSSMPFSEFDNSDFYFMAYDHWDQGEPFYNIRLSNQHGYEVIENTDWQTGGVARPVVLRRWDRSKTPSMFFSKRGMYNYRTDPDEMYKIYSKSYPFNGYDTEQVEIDGDFNDMQAYGYPIELPDGRVLMFYNSSSFTSQIHVAELIDA